jgi:hypothetical protein
MVCDLHQLPDSTVELRAISLWNPWAMWVALGWKTVETRLHDRFASLERKRVAIHAALTWDVSAIESARKYLSTEQIRETVQNLKTWPSGAFICTVDVEDYRVTETTDAKAALIECDTPRFGLYLSNVKLFVPPILARGRQGIWKAQLPL